MSNDDDRSLRLTLRTLLAWLDDQLPPTEVRQIGQKVKESPFAQELAGKIKKVTRRRRFTVPPSTGADATDPNTVASYLDNHLDAEKVTQYEEKCLHSDVDLAEVSSCHQILSMLGQRAKVPPEARYRMYRLVKGREAIGREPRRSASTLPPEPTAKPIPSWDGPGGPRGRSFLQRMGPPAAVAALMLLMAVSAWKMLPEGDRVATPLPPVSKAEDASPKDQTVDARDELAKPVAKPVGGPRDPRLAQAGPELEKPVGAVAGAPGGLERTEMAVAPVEEPEEDQTVAPGPRFATVVDLGEGLLLRWRPEERTWTTLEEQQTLHVGDRVVAPAPFRPVLQEGQTTLRLIGPTDIELLPPANGETMRLALAQGKVVIQSQGANATTVLIEGQAIEVRTPVGIPIGLSRVDNWPPGAVEPAAPSCVIYSPEGQVELTSGGTAETLSGPGSVVFRLPARFTDVTSEAPPSWVTAKSPPEVDLLTGQDFATYFDPGVSTIRALVEAVEDEQPTVRRLAVSTLGVLGGIDMVLPALIRPDDPTTRRAAVAALRDYADKSPKAAQELREALVQFNGEPWAAIVYKLLSGYTEEEAGQQATYVQLVGLLGHPDVGVRDLALEQLMRLTGRDALQYDPEAPTGAGLDAWRALLRSGDIRPAGVAPSPSPVTEPSAPTGTGSQPGTPSEP